MTSCILSALNDSFVVTGYSTNWHLLLDLDHTGYCIAKKIAAMVYKNYPFLGTYLILHSSRDNFHVVYDRKIGWNRILKIVSTLAQLHLLNADYMRIRKFRGDLTLRTNGYLTSTGIKFPPMPLLLYIPKHYSTKKCSGILCYLEVLRAFNPYWSQLFRRYYCLSLLKVCK